MHIPENYLSPSTCAVLTAAMLPVWVHAARKIKTDLPKEKITMIGVGAAFSFIGMMFNIPLPGGTTGHAVGGTLIAALLGPNAACIAVSVALLLQALLFGDGGILAFGANCFNMAFAMPYLGYFIYKLLTKALSKDGQTSTPKKVISIAIASYIGINVASLLASIEFGIQPYLFKDELGNALYCPYDLSVSIPSMMIGHLTIFGLAEVIFSSAILAFVCKMSPNLLEDKLELPVEKKHITPVGILLGLLVILVPLGLLAEGTAWGEWGVEEMAELTNAQGVALGYTPKGMETGFSMETLIPDYAIEGMPDIAAYILSAVIGVAVLIIIFRLISALKKKTK